MLARPSAAARTANCTVKRHIRISIEVYTFHEKAEEPRRFLVRRGTASWNNCTWPGPSHQELPYAMMPRPIVKHAASSEPAGGRSGAGIELNASKLYGMKMLASSIMIEVKPASSVFKEYSKPCPVMRGTKNKYALFAHGAQQV